MNIKSLETVQSKPRFRGRAIIIVVKCPRLKKIERKVAAGIDGIETRRPRGSFLAKTRGRDSPEVGSKKSFQARESETKATGKACFQRLESHFASPLK